MANIKKSLGLNPDEHFHIPRDVYDFFADIPDRGDAHEAGWKVALLKYHEDHPVLADEFGLRVAGKLSYDWTKCIPPKEELNTAQTPSRKSAGVVTSALGEMVKSFMVGTADLTPSCNVAFKNKVDFQSVSAQCSIILLCLGAEY